MELREECIPWIVADVESSLPCVFSLRPREVVNVLVALLQPALRTAEIGSGSRSVRMDNAGLVAVVCGRSDKTGKDETRLVGNVGGERRNQANIYVRVVVGAGSEVVRSNIAPGLDDHIARAGAVHCVAQRKQVVLRNLIVHFAAVKKVVDRLLHRLRSSERSQSQRLGLLAQLKAGKPEQAIFDKRTAEGEAAFLAMERGPVATIQ